MVMGTGWKIVDERGQKSSYQIYSSDLIELVLSGYVQIHPLATTY